MDLSPILISLKTATAAVALTFVLGLFAAWGVVSLRSRRLQMVLDGLLTLPLVLPPTVLGFLLLMIFGVNRPIGAFLLEFLGVTIVFSWPATVLASMAISFPLMYRAARGAFEQVDPVYLMAARTLGMSEGQVFRKVLLPLALPGVVAGGILSFARGLGEFGATAMIAGNIAGKTRTLPMAIYSEVAAGNMEAALYYVLVILAISFLVVLGMNYFSGKEGKRGRKERRAEG